jgi:hypothetical protein
MLSLCKFSSLACDYFPAWHYAKQGVPRMQGGKVGFRGDSGAGQPCHHNDSHVVNYIGSSRALVSNGSRKCFREFEDLHLKGGYTMRKSYHFLGSLLLAGILASPLVITAAIPPQTKTTKQPSGATTNNAHPWNHNEEQSYRAYRHDNHLGNKAYNKLTPEEQTKYWNWRANHPENLGHPDSLVGRQNPNNPPPPPARAPSSPAPSSNPPQNR